MTNKYKGFAAMDDKKHKDAAAKGGKTGSSHTKDHEHKTDHKKK